MEHAVCHELVDPFAGQEGGIQLDDRLRPEQTGVELVLYELVDATVADRDEAARVVGVVGNKPFSQVEDFYVCLSFLVRFEEPVTAKAAAKRSRPQGNHRPFETILRSQTRISIPGRVAAYSLG
jgi:hypothetical protein